LDGGRLVAKIATSEESVMGNPVVHFEIIGTAPDELRAYYGELFGWTYNVESPVAAEVSDAGAYGFIDVATNDGAGIPGGVGGGAGFAPRSLFYVGVGNVEAALARAEELGGTRLSGPHLNPNNALSVGFFRDPEGNLIGVAGPA
jgi:predicted enzyme related to lactoylglutathione lyase